ncbi:hypothetical protein J6590_004399 [Homalodisca vitripennis]|nr:hypothetical protein J6590_004399 [Homalodisca vitripennis]
MEYDYVMNELSRARNHIRSCALRGGPVVPDDARRTAQNGIPSLPSAGAVPSHSAAHTSIANRTARIIPTPRATETPDVTCTCPLAAVRGGTLDSWNQESCSSEEMQEKSETKKLKMNSLHLFHIGDT